MPPEMEDLRPRGRKAEIQTAGEAESSVPPTCDGARGRRRFRRVEIDRGPGWQLVAWAEAWLAGDHHDDQACPTCTAGWALLDEAAR